MAVTNLTGFAVSPQTITASKTLTKDDSGKVTVVSAAAGLTATLPAALGTGNTFKFFVNTAVTSNSVIIKVANSTDIMKGNIIANSTGDTPDLAQPWPTAADSDTITLNGSTTGGAGGDIIEVTDVASGVFMVSGVITASGTEATPFSATV